MRNLKKILALVLALVMSMSVMSVASADFTDSASVKFTEAVETLAALEVFKGYEDESFRPTANITRAEVAAIIYRIDTADIKDEQVKIYSDYNKFSDVSKDAWYAGYVNYCANALYVKGTSDTTFEPNAYVTGYQALAMILRVVGYDQNNEFTGSAWQIEVAKYANKLGITKNVNANTLGAPATRELVAELLYRTVVDVKQVDYTLAFGYSDTKLNGTENKTIEQEKMGMFTTNEKGDRVKNLSTAKDDEWGRPGATLWVAPLWTKTVLANLGNGLLKTTYEPMNECEIAVVMGMGKTTTVPVYYNGVAVDKEINPLHTSHTNPAHQVGEQGTLMEIYADRIVMIDTYLAVVTDATEQKTDKAGHIISYATNKIDVYTNDGVKTFTETYKTAKATYAVGTYLLVSINEAGEKDVLYVTGTPDVKVGAQSKIHWNQEKHTITVGEATETYTDNVNYVLDAAERTTKKDFYWFFDAQGFVIGSTDVPPAAPAPDQYVVVTGVQWVNASFANGYAQAKVIFLDNPGEVVNAIIASVDGNTMEYAYRHESDFAAGKVNTTWQYNEDTTARLYTYTYNKAGELVLKAADTYVADAVQLDQGISHIVGEFYGDKETVYYFFNGETLDEVTGYTDAYLAGANKLGLTAKNNTFIMGSDAFVDMVYVANATANKAGSDATSKSTVTKFVYLTDDAFALQLADGNFYLAGVVDHEGNTDALKIFGNTYGANTEAVLDELVKLYQDTLLKYTYTYETNKDGSVKVATSVIEPVLLGSAKLGGLTAQYLGAADYYFIGTGVLKFKETALNVTQNTIIINEDGEAVDVTDPEFWYNTNIYAIYDSKNFAKVIFVTPVESAFEAMTAVNFSDVITSEMTTFDAVYGVQADFEATIVEAVEKSVTVNAVYELNGDTVVVEAVLDVANAKVDVILTVGDIKKTVEVAVNVTNKAEENK